MVSEVRKNQIMRSYYIGFMDDISITSNMKENHEQYIRAMIDTLYKNNYKRKDRKCTFR
jgi:hypothetical protein